MIESDLNVTLVLLYVYLPRESLYFRVPGLWVIVKWSTRITSLVE